MKNFQPIISLVIPVLHSSETGTTMNNHSLWPRQRGKKKLQRNDVTAARRKKWHQETGEHFETVEGMVKLPKEQWENPKMDGAGVMVLYT